MPTAPLYRRGETVYLKSSAELGKLESYKITSIKQLEKGRWLYRIDIAKKPPDQNLVGDSFDIRVNEMDILFTEGELITVCEALDIICGRFRNKLASLEIQIASRCGGTDFDAPVVNLDEPRWEIGDSIYFKASAKIGFMHHDCVKSVYEIGIQPGSRRTRYVYQVVNIPNPRITFREDELITFCEAAELALASCNRDLANAEAKRASLCI